MVIKQLVLRGLFLLLIVVNVNGVKAQLINIDSALISSLHENLIFSKLIEDKDGNNGQIPIVVSKDLIKLFNLNDTIVDGVKVYFISSYQAAVKKMMLVRSKESILSVNLSLSSSILNEIKLEIAYGAFVVNKNLLEGNKKVLLARSNEYLMTCDLKKGRSYIEQIIW